MTEEHDGKEARLLTFDDMMSTALERDEVDCPEWGGFVPIRELSAANRVTMTKRLSNGRGGIDWSKLDQFSPFLLVHGVTDEEGNLCLSNKQAEALHTKSSKVVTRIAQAIARLSGFSKQAQEDTLKN